MDQLRVDNPKYVEAVSRGRWIGNLKPYIYNFDILSDDSIRIPRGMRIPLLHMIENIKDEVTIIDKRSQFDFQTVDSAAIKYRSYQEKAMHVMYQAAEGLLVAPAGSGKTVIGLSMIPLFGQPTLWLTHTRALALQAIERVASFLPSIDEVGLLGDGKWKVGDLVTVGLIPTLVRRPQEVHRMRNDFGLVILDEAHHCPASTFLKVMSGLNPYYLFGLTATPYRRDKLEELMFQTIGPAAHQITVEEVDSAGGIVMPKVLYRSIYGKHISDNNIQSILKDEIVPNEKRNGIIVGDVLREAVSGNYCIVVTDRKAHAEILHDLISTAWEKTGIATGNYTKKQQTEVAERLNNKEITVLVCTFALLGEGFDVPFLNRAFVTLPFRAEGRIEQLIGRIQRSAPGKDDALVYDYVDVNIGVVENQFFTKSANDCRFKAYKRLGLEVVPYG